MYPRATSRRTCDTTQALLHLAVDYYASFGSRGYRLQCRCLRRFRRWGVERPLDMTLTSAALALYDRLRNAGWDTRL